MEVIKIVLTKVLCFCRKGEKSMKTFRKFLLFVASSSLLLSACSKDVVTSIPSNGSSDSPIADSADVPFNSDNKPKKNGEHSSPNVLTHSCFDEYYCDEIKACIRLYEDNTFQYEDDNNTFSHKFSAYGSFIITEFSFVVGDPELPSSYLSSRVIFEKKNDTLIANEALSTYGTDFNLNGKTFALTGESVNEDIVDYRYDVKEAQKLIVDMTFANDYKKDNINEVLNDLNLIKYINNVTRFSNPSYTTGRIQFDIDLENINFVNVIKEFKDAKDNNQAVRSYNYSFDDDEYYMTTNLVPLGLSIDDKVENSTLLKKISGSIEPFEENECLNGLFLSTYQETLDYINSLRDAFSSRHDESEIVNFIQTVDENVFADNNLVFSNLVTEPDSSVTYSFDDIYLKDDTLYISTTRKIVSGGGFQVVTFDVFVCLIGKAISFSKIVTI